LADQNAHFVLSTLAWLISVIFATTNSQVESIFHIAIDYRMLLNLYIIQSHNKAFVLNGSQCVAMGKVLAPDSFATNSLKQGEACY